jgi:hypothetical protein
MHRKKGLCPVFALRRVSRFFCKNGALLSLFSKKTGRCLKRRTSVASPLRRVLSEGRRVSKVMCFVWLINFLPR